ncbi:MAG TPA: retropepsin-like aspartic protease [Stellaceae bacterium]|nr:retropepsin-like aspartic protease [Stellaceae bacterium]
MNIRMVVSVLAPLVVALGWLAMPAHAEDCRPVRLVELPVVPLGNIPTVTLRVNGSPVSFLFDTGAERTILSAATAKRLRLDAHYEYERRMRSIGSAMASGDARLASLGSGGLAMTDFRVLVGPVSLPSVAGKPLDGLLGADFFTGFEVDLDLARRRIILYEPPPCPIDAPDWSAPYDTIEANRSLHDRLFFPIRLDGHSLAALIDTGAQLTTLDTEAAAAIGVTEAVLARDPVITLRGAAAEEVRSHAHRFAGLQIDGESLRDQTIMVARLGLQDADLVLGADFLRWQRVWLSYRSHLIFLERRS